MKIGIKEKIALLVMATGVLCYSFYNIFMVKNIAKINELNAKKSEVTEFASDITPLLKESAKLKKTRNDLRAKSEAILTNSDGYTATNEEFLKYLGERTEKNEVDIVSFKELGESDENGIYKLMIDFEIKGNESNLNKVLSDIDKMGIKYSVGSVSIRQNEEYKYLKRFYDNLTELPWYNEPTEEELKEEETNEKANEITDDFLNELPNVIPTIPPVDNTQIPNLEEIPENKKEDVLPPNENNENNEKNGKEENINDRLNELLSGISFSINNNNSKIILLENKENKNNEELKMAVSVCFIMFKEPDVTTSFYNSPNITGGNNGIF